MRASNESSHGSNTEYAGRVVVERLVTHADQALQIAVLKLKPKNFPSLSDPSPWGTSTAIGTTRTTLTSLGSSSTTGKGDVGARALHGTTSGPMTVASNEHFVCVPVHPPLGPSPALDGLPRCRGTREGQ